MTLEKRLQNWIEAYDRNGYLNGAILAASNGTIVANRGFGMANFEHCVPNTPATKFRIGSLTKSFTAMAIFQLHERRRLNVNDAIGYYLPDYPDGDRITIYHCLTNTAGIPNYSSFPDFWARTMRLPSTLTNLIGSFKNRELEFEPGSGFGYSNSGYSLLTAIIERVSGMSYADYVKAHICVPLDMRSTGCDDGLAVIPGLASGYSYWKEPIRAAYTDMSFPLGAYGMYSTTEDLLKWDKALASSALIAKELSDKMFTPFRNGYACGWMVSEIAGRTCMNHFGDISGYFSDFLRFAEDRVTVVFLSNMNVTPVTHLSRELANAIFGESAAIPQRINPIQLQGKEAFTGQYMAEDKMLDISLEDGELYVTVPKMYGVHYKFKLVPVQAKPSQTVFITEMIHEQLVFGVSIKGEIKSLTYTDCLGQIHAGYKKGQPGVYNKG